MILNPKRDFHCHLSIQEDGGIVVCIFHVHTIHNAKECSKKCAYRVPVYSLDSSNKERKKEMNLSRGDLHVESKFLTTKFMWRYSNSSIITFSLVHVVELFIVLHEKLLLF